MTSNTPASVVEALTTAAEWFEEYAEAHQLVMRTIYGDRLIDMGATLGVPGVVTFAQAVRATATALRADHNAVLEEIRDISPVGSDAHKLAVQAIRNRGDAS